MSIFLRRRLLLLLLVLLVLLQLLILLLLVLVLLVLVEAFAAERYQRAKTFTTDRGRPSFARGNYGEQIILSAAQYVVFSDSVLGPPRASCLILREANCPSSI